MKPNKKGNGFAGWNDVRELTDQELDSVLGGVAATKPADYEFVIDTADARYTYEAHLTDGKNFKADGVIKTNFEKSKNPYFKSGGKNTHVIDLTDLK